MPALPSRDPNGASGPNLTRLRDFVGALTALVDGTCDEPTLLGRGALLLEDLIAHDDWLPAEYAVASAARYQQYLLHCDVRARFSLVSFVWTGEQATPIHDHTVWGLIGQLRGAEWNQRYARAADGRGDAALEHDVREGADPLRCE